MSQGADVTLTTRLSVFFLATLALVVAGFSATLFLLARSYLHRQCEERLEAALNTLVASVEIGPDGLLEWEPTQRHLKLGPGAFGDEVLWLVSDAQGVLVDRSKQAHAEEFLAEAAVHLSSSQPTTHGLDWRGEHWQYLQRWVQPAKKDPGKAALTEPILPTDEKKYPALLITAGVPLQPVQATLRQLAGALVGLSLAIWLLALFAGRAVCRRALLPVRRMAASAGEITAESLERRLPAIATSDELEDLNRAINSLLDRLQDSFERQRRFTGDASHQLRTPLTALLGQIEVALRRERPPGEYQRVLATVHNKAEHLRRIIETLLFLARADTEAQLPEKERIDLKNWVSQQIGQWSEHERCQDIALECAGAASYDVAVQPALLGELLNILIDNACKYSPRGSPIQIRLSQDEQAVRIEVEDQGCGIADSDLPHLFTPFFRSAESRRLGVEGCGLGLSIAQRLATACGGTLTVISTKGRGSCFTFAMARASDNLHLKNAFSGSS